MMKPNKGICVDGSSRGNPGIAGYQAVDLSTGEQLFKVDIGISTNNIAEFLGLAHAISYAKKNGYTEIYSDSVTAIAWIRNKKAKSTLVLNDKTKKSLDFIERTEKYLNTIDPSYMNLVNKWETKKWGENKADFGFK